MDIQSKGDLNNQLAEYINSELVNKVEREVMRKMLIVDAKPIGAYTDTLGKTALDINTETT